MAMVADNSPPCRKAAPPKIRPIRRDSRDSKDSDDASENERLEEGMQFFDSFQVTPTNGARACPPELSFNVDKTANTKIARTEMTACFVPNSGNGSRKDSFNRSESNSAASLDSSEYAMNEAVSGALVGENVVDSPQPHQSKKAHLNTQPPNKSNANSNNDHCPQQRYQTSASTPSWSQDYGEGTSSLVADLSLGLVTQGFSWIRSHREERRRRALQQQAEEQARKIREAQLVTSPTTNSTFHSALTHVCGDDLVKVVDPATGYDVEVDDEDNIIQKTGISRSGDGYVVEFAVPNEHEEDLDWVPPVRIEEEENLSSAPYILDQEQRQLIAQKVLPSGIAYAKWKRLYSLARDGDSFEACLRLVAGNDQTLMVVRTSKNEILGGFGDYAWDHPATSGTVYFGGPTSCLFKFVKRNQSQSSSFTDKEDDDGIRVYKWTGANRYIQLCDATHKMLAFGGGGEDGSFGLAVAQDFQHGSSGPCDTFDNENLASEGSFSIVDLEIFSFLLGQF